MSMTAKEKIEYATKIRENCRTEIIKKGVDVPENEPFKNYPDKIKSIQGAMDDIEIKGSLYTKPREKCADKSELLGIDTLEIKANGDYHDCNGEETDPPVGLFSKGENHGLTQYATKIEGFKGINFKSSGEQAKNLWFSYGFGKYSNKLPRSVTVKLSSTTYPSISLEANSPYVFNIFVSFKNVKQLEYSIFTDCNIKVPEECIATFDLPALKKYEITGNDYTSILQNIKTFKEDGKKPILIKIEDCKFENLEYIKLDQSNFGSFPGTNILGFPVHSDTFNYNEEVDFGKISKKDLSIDITVNLFSSGISLPKVLKIPFIKQFNVKGNPTARSFGGEGSDLYIGNYPITEVEEEKSLYRRLLVSMAEENESNPGRFKFHVTDEAHKADAIAQLKSLEPDADTSFIIADYVVPPKEVI